MKIEILPARLANQIAAGEVVERPASVVKELVENSLDAGATRIQIDIERGGHKLIRIRDNGSGIVKDELALALSRHATSKLKTLDDLENICSLGFRGEALASISSVSRLTLSSKPAAQAEAWQAFAEGREMAVQVRPTAHPDGTTIEVKDLFFNTPARRKFLRTEKTEFSHIDELVKRIALSRFDVALTLTHNGKVVRQYRPQADEANHIQRVAQVAGKLFSEHALHLVSGGQGLQLKGWVLPLGMAKEPQYTYVNGRMMRDKLILHAIRQAFEEVCGEQEMPALVLYLDIDPRQVDVNVHPAKHEVRFHQARLVHDFILQAVKQVVDTPASSASGLPDAVHAFEAPRSSEFAQVPAFAAAPVDYPKSQLRPLGGHAGGYDAAARKPVSTEQFKQVNAFYQGVSEAQATHFDQAQVQTESRLVDSELLPLPGGVCLFSDGEGLLASHFRAVLPLYWHERIREEGALGGRALLLPVRVSLDERALSSIRLLESWLMVLGFDIELKGHFAMVKKLPACVYSQDVSQVLDRVLCAAQEQLTEIADWLIWLAGWTTPGYFEGQEFVAIKRALLNNPVWMTTLREKAVKIDLSDTLQQLERNFQT